MQKSIVICNIIYKTQASYTSHCHTLSLYASSHYNDCPYHLHLDLSFLLPSRLLFFFFFNDPPTTEIYTLSLHDALPISCEASFKAPWQTRNLVPQVVDCCS